MKYSVKYYVTKILLFLKIVKREKIFYIGGSEALPPPLSREEEVILLIGP